VRTLSRVGSALAVLAPLLFAGCASRKLPLPTLEDYSDRVSIWAERFLEDWKSGAKDPSLYAASLRWSGPLPGDALAAAPSRAPLEIRVYRAPSAPTPRPSPGERGRTSEEVRLRLREIRSRFATLGRAENILFDFRRRGEKRDVLLSLLLTGRDADGRLRQEGGKVRAVLAPDGRGNWRLESAALLEWISATAPTPRLTRPRLDLGDHPRWPASQRRRSRLIRICSTRTATGTFIAASVSRPALPSVAKPCRSWNAFTAATSASS